MAPHATGNSVTPPDRKNVHLLIVGGGLCGLILAQGLRKFNASPAAAAHSVTYTFSVFERDHTALARGAGYSLSIHWALKQLHDALPAEVEAGLAKCVTNPHAVDAGDNGHYQYLNLRTGDPVVKYPITAITLSRLSREKLIKLLMTGLDVQFSKQLDDITYLNEDIVTAHFKDGSEETGNLLIGADGVRSAVRQQLCPGPLGRNSRLPVRMVGLRCVYPVSKIQKCLGIDPYFYHGGDPVRNGYFWFSVIDLPRPEDLTEASTAECQMTMSWPYDALFMGLGEPADVPATNEGRLAWMRRLAAPWGEPMREMVYDIAEGTEVREIGLEDWLPEKGKWDNHGGRVTIVGDAAHAMTIFRGEAANHGIVDVSNLLNLLIEYGNGKLDLKKVIDTFEEEMIERTAPAALRAHQACLDANHFNSVKTGSSFLGQRAAVIK